MQCFQTSGVVDVTVGVGASSVNGQATHNRQNSAVDLVVKIPTHCTGSSWKLDD